MNNKSKTNTYSWSIFYFHMCSFGWGETAGLFPDSDEGWRQQGWRMGGPSSVIPPSVSADVKHTDRQEENASHYITALIHCASSDDLSTVCVWLVCEDACIFRSEVCMWVCVDYLKQLCKCVCAVYDILHNPVTIVTQLIFLMICKII